MNPGSALRLVRSRVAQPRIAVSDEGGIAAVHEIEACPSRTARLHPSLARPPEVVPDRAISAKLNLADPAIPECERKPRDPCVGKSPPIKRVRRPPGDGNGSQTGIAGVRIDPRSEGRCRCASALRKRLGSAPEQQQRNQQGEQFHGWPRKLWGDDHRPSHAGPPDQAATSPRGMVAAKQAKFAVREQRK